MSRSDGTNGYAFPQQRTSLAPSFVDRLLRLGEPCGSAGCSARRGHEGHRLQPVRHIEATMQAPQMPADLPPPLPPLQPRDLPSAGLFVRLYVTGWFLLSGLAVGYFTLLLVNPEAVARISAFAWSTDLAQKPQRTNTPPAMEPPSVPRTLAGVQPE